MTNIIDMESLEFVLVVLRAMVKRLISIQQENQSGLLLYAHIQDMIGFSNNVKEQFDQVNARLSRI
jgi:hypothetical protein